MQVLQLTDICSYLNLKKTEDLEKTLTLLINLLVYIEKGDQIKTSSVEFEKLSDNLVYINTTSLSENLSELLMNKKIVKIPV